VRFRLIDPVLKDLIKVYKALAIQEADGADQGRDRARCECSSEEMLDMSFGMKLFFKY
jgi:hypothetical protein